MNEGRREGGGKRRGLSLPEYLRRSPRRLALPWTGLTGLKLTGYRLYDVYRSPEKQARTAAALEAALGADFTGILDDGIICSETLGLPITAFDGDFPSVSTHPVKTAGDVAALRVPDPAADGRMPVNLRSLERVALQSARPVAVSVEGPFTLAGQLAGVERLAGALIREPGFTRALLAFTSATVAAYARALVAAGADLVSLAEPTAIILSPRQFDRHVAPRVREVLGGLDCWKAVHLCGDTRHLLDALPALGADALSLDQVMDVPAVLKRVPGDLVVFGNVDPLVLLSATDPARIDAVSRRLLGQVAEHPNFLMSTGCDCALDTPVGNLRALVDAAHGFPQPARVPKARHRGPEPVPAAPKRPTRALPPPKPTGNGDVIEALCGAVLHFDPAACVRACEEVIRKKRSVSAAVQRGLAEGMRRAGDLFADGVYYIPELVLCSRTLYIGLDILGPYLPPGDFRERGRLMIGVIEGDIHEIGKNLVAAMFRAAGWEVDDLGVNVAPGAFVEAYDGRRPDLVGISALMATSMMRVPEAVAALRRRFPAAGILVGGAPLTEEWAERFGADGYAPDAVGAVAEGRRLFRKTIARPACPSASANGGAP